MRKYTDKFVRERLVSRLNLAACPFPGKSPLRLFIRVGEKILYHGKFNSAVWRQFYKKPLRRNMWFQIYDKAGPIIYGTNMSAINNTSGLLVYRYFAHNWMTGDQLTRVTSELIGPYRVYLNDTEPGQLDRPLNRPRFIHHVNSNIPHIRTI